MPKAQATRVCAWMRQLATQVGCVCLFHLPWTVGGDDEAECCLSQAGTADVGIRSLLS